MMDGIILIDKDKNFTSRDIVNKVSKKLGLKKVGHAGTLDPIATGVLVIGVGKATKILDLLTLDKKEYIAKVKMGIATDTYDITGNIIKENRDFTLEKKVLERVLKSFQKEYLQTVPKYSAVKINGKKLYEYARRGLRVELPKRLVNIYEIELLDYNIKAQTFTFKTLVSKGTYIRSLIEDIGESLNIPLTLLELVRTKSGKFLLENSCKVDGEYQVISIKDALDIKEIVIDNDNLLKKVKNGNSVILENINEDKILFLNSEKKELAIYMKTKNHEYKAFKVF